MGKFKYELLAIIVAFFVTLSFNNLVEWLNSDDGNIIIQSIDAKSGEKSSIIHIENFTQKTINNLKLVVSTSTDISNISSSSPIQINREKNDLLNQDSKLLIISLIPSQTVTTIVIPSSFCSPINTKELRISDHTNQKITSPIYKAFMDGLQTAIIYSVIFFFILLWEKTRLDELQKRIKENEKAISKSRDQLDSLHKETNRIIKEANNRFVKQRIILVKRISDYSKELNFWRNTIKQILRNNFSKSDDVNLIITEITKGLRTYGTNDKFTQELETIEEMADYLREYEDVEGKGNKLN